MTIGKYFPLMQSNDAFITSAVMVGLIDKIVWVKPDWNADEGDAGNGMTHITVYIGKHIGTYEGLCLCMRESKNEETEEEDTSCIYINYNYVEDERPEIDIEESQCEQISRNFLFHVVSESNFKHLDFDKYYSRDSIIVDIDEDYFGVESGVKKFIEQGISLQTQEALDTILSRLYCPLYISSEQFLHQKLRAIFQMAHEAKRSNQQDGLEEKMKLKIAKETSPIICNQSLVVELARFITQLDADETVSLSKASFCLYDSPRLRKSGKVSESKSIGFSLCHGTIYPTDILNKIHVGNMQEINQRTNQMKDILQQIHLHVKPSMYTICRSLRDGYTPRNQQRYIEQNVLQVVSEVTRGNDRIEHIIYDSQLVFGKQGWIQD